MEKVIGKSYPLKDAALKVTGQMKYVADMKPQNVLYAKMLLSPVAHAKIKSIDTSEAEKVVIEKMLDLPANAISGIPSAGYCDLFTALIVISELLIFIIFTTL